MSAKQVYIWPMRKLLFLLFIPLIFSCSYSRIFTKNGTYSCIVYSYTHIFTELSEKERYVAKVMQYKNGSLMHEEEFVRSGESAHTKTYIYNVNGQLDTVKLFRQDVDLPIVYKYKNGQLVESYDLYRGKIQMREKHYRTDTSHMVEIFLGGYFTNTMYVSYNADGNKVKEEFYSPQGEFFGMNQYFYTDFGKLSRFERYNSSKVMGEVTNYTYDNNQNLTWEITTDEQSKLITKFKYEYGK